jgi:chromosome segregation ATPase
MDQKREQPQQQKRAGPLTTPNPEADAQGDSLVERARELQTEQASLPEPTSVEAAYSAALGAQLEAKHGQVERVEDRLENLIEQQASKLQQCRSRQPGLIALPGNRARWQQQLQQQQSTMQRLQGRLEIVREIKDGMGVHGPRIEELATRKLRHQEPGLASEWDEVQEAQRLNLAHQRREQQERERWKAQKAGLGLSHTLAINQRPI